MRRKHLQSWIIFPALAGFVWVATPARAQSTPAQDNRPVQDNDTTRQDLASFDRFLDYHPDFAERIRKDPSLVNDEGFLKNNPALQDYLQQHPAVAEEVKENPDAFMRQEDRYDRREDDRDRQELANFDRFLDGHREIADQLRRDPSLVDNQDYLKGHPELQDYLDQRPELRRQIDENPDAFMRAEDRYDRRDNDRDRDPDADRDRQELANFDRFLDSHRETAEQLRRDPNLVNNQEFLKNHPELQQYLQQHPEISQQLKADPKGFMEEEVRYEQRQDDRNRDANYRDDDRNRDNDNNRDADRDRDPDNRDRDADRDRDANRGELANFDRFLDSHHETAEQLHRDPSQIDNAEFLKSHPALQTYLQDHPGVRQQIEQNPNAFMQEEARYDRSENGGADRNSPDHRPYASFGQFLGGHSDVARDLSGNPSLAKDHDYLNNHPELRDYLKAHPDVQQGLNADPQTFIKSAQQFNTTTPGQPMKTPAPTPDAPAKPKQ